MFYEKKIGSDTIDIIQLAIIAPPLPIISMIHAIRLYENLIHFNYSMLSDDGAGGRSSLEKFQSKTVKFSDIQTRCFWSIRDPTTIPATLIKNPAN